MFSTSSPNDEVVPCFVVCDAVALSESGDMSVDTARGTLFKSTNLKAGNFEGLWSRR